MGFHEMVRGRRYEKLSEKRQGRWCWVKRANNNNNGLKRLKGIRVSRSKKLTLKLFSVTTKMYNEVIKRMNAVDNRGAYPNIVFTSHWGLPVLSHSPSFNTTLFNI